MTKLCQGSPADEDGDGRFISKNSSGWVTFRDRPHNSGIEKKSGECTGVLGICWESSVSDMISWWQNGRTYLIVRGGRIIRQGLVGQNLPSNGLDTFVSIRKVSLNVATHFHVG
jgi:hypothetical protein